MQLNDIEKIKAAGGAVSELMYKAALDLEKQASQAQRQVIEYQQHIQQLKEFRKNETRKIFAQAYSDNGFQEEDDGFDESTDELYLPNDFPAPQSELPYVDISALLYKVNGLAGDDDLKSADPYRGVQNGFKFVSAENGGMYNDVLYIITFRPSGYTDRAVL